MAAALPGLGVGAAELDLRGYFGRRKMRSVASGHDYLAVGRELDGGWGDAASGVPATAQCR
jgi:hypothetical protein